MRKEITVTIPESWAEVSLKKYLELQKDLENHEGDPLAQFHFTIYHLCGIDANLINQMTKEAHTKIKTALDNLIIQQELPLQRIITIDGIEYGFEPNLSKISYGAYIDITKYDTLAIDSNWAKIMSILYRPITQKSKETYSITPYTGDVDETPFLELGMDKVFGCYFFFINLSKELVSAILNSTTGTLPPNIKSILQRSGEVIRQSTISQEETYKKWIGLQTFH